MRSSAYSSGRRRPGARATARLIVGFGFRELCLHRIGLRVYSHNQRAQRAYAKLGFIKEGVLRESYYRGGVFHDTIVMSILQSEWRGT